MGVGVLVGVGVFVGVIVGFGVAVGLFVGVGVAVGLFVGVGVGVGETVAVEVGVGVGVGSIKVAGAAAPTGNLLAKKASTATAGSKPARRISYLAALAI